MNLFRIGIFAFAAFGATWAAEQLVLSISPEAEPVVVAQAEQASSPSAPESAPAAAEGAESGGASAQIEALSGEEIEQELARIEAAVSGAEVDELEEFTPTKPLAADLAIALPSDI